MAGDEQKDIEEQKPHSVFDEKMKHLLDEVDEKLEQIGGDFGPILMEELQNRLEKIVKNFNEEVNELFNESFKKWKLTDTQLREFVNSEIQLPQKMEKTEGSVDKKGNTPTFIKDIEFGPVRPKKN
tara:strand:- start:289 stop:666 length:378 start_codon:yes stop_codon:yes gene_type:complete